MELFALKKSIYLNKPVNSMITEKILNKIKCDNFWYKQIAQAAMNVDNYEIFSKIYLPNISVKFNFSNIGIKILHLIARNLEFEQFMYLMKKFITDKTLLKIKTMMFYYNVKEYGIPDSIWAKLDQKPSLEIFEFLIEKVNYEYPKYLFDNSTDIFVNQWVNLIPEKYYNLIKQFVSASISSNKINYLKIVLSKFSNILKHSIKPNELLDVNVNNQTFSYVLSNNLVNLTDLSIFNKLIGRIINGKLVGVLKPLLSNKAILDQIRLINNVNFAEVNFLPLEIVCSAGSIAAMAIQQQNQPIFDLFLSKGVYSQYKSFWLELALVKNATKMFDSILETCSYYDIMESDYRIIFISSINPKYLVKILEKFNRLNNFNPELYSSLFYRQLYTSIKKLDDKIISAIPSTYNPIYICNVLLASNTTKNGFNRIVDEHKNLIEANLDSILDELIQMNSDLNIKYLLEKYPDSSLYEDAYLHLINYTCSAKTINFMLIDLCEFFSSEVDLRIDNDYLFSQLFPRCTNRLVYDYFVNKYPQVYSYFVNRKSEIIGIKIGSKIIGEETDGFIELKKIKLTNIDQCLICCETESNIITKCSHQYCLSCLTQWYKQGKDSCPVCRQEYYPVNIIE